MIHVDKTSIYEKAILDIILRCEWITKALIKPRGARAGFAPLLFKCNKIRFPCVAAQIISMAYHAVLTLMAVSFIAKFSFPFGCFVFDKIN